jgi:hypothetical protein
MKSTVVNISLVMMTVKFERRKKHCHVILEGRKKATVISTKRMTPVKKTKLTKPSDKKPSDITKYSWHTKAPVKSTEQTKKRLINKTDDKMRLTES